jgi:DnaJ-class molecular chaperone
MLSTVFDNKCVCCSGTGKYLNYSICYLCNGTGYNYSIRRSFYELKENIQQRYMKKYIDNYIRNR